MLRLEDCGSVRSDSLGAASVDAMRARAVDPGYLAPIEPEVVPDALGEVKPNPKKPNPAAGLPCSLPANGLVKSKSKSCLDDAVPFGCLVSSC